ncbi:metal-dependent transcriptional regulator [Aminipila terrae]|uniref:Manganese transport regulator n=1 Tax=Aminipila terrae TaxID=2697030 RepID=A0A6P1MMW4_9FIRM|nr:iron dependent repressor, metal binding and dimerization domain protein [Aminipila terrae]QHI73428.1 DtxR family transcriptional regulator [Aminipila terrae]
MNKQDFYTVRGYQLLNQNLLTPSMEDYLEMIYRICLDEEFIRINELANKLNVRPSSATKIVQKLKILGFVYYQKYGYITLTKEGIDVGSFLLNRHITIENFLNLIGVEDAFKDTEMIEHDISLNSLTNINMLNDFFNNNPKTLKQYEMYKEKWKSEKK